MAEIGLVLSIASLLKVSAKVLTECAAYIEKVKNAPADIDKIINEVSGLVFILKRLSALASSTPDDDVRLVSLRGMLMLPSGPFKSCEDGLSEIAKKLGKITSSNLRRKLLWPFESEKLEELLKGLERHKTMLRTALSVDTGTTNIATNDTVNKIGAQLEDMKAREERKRISDWLRGADPSTNHNSARKRHEPGTGEWLLKLKEFEEWREGDGNLLWLYGIPGAGKTILSSAVVEHLKKRQSEAEQSTKVAYFYFDFNDHAKQTAQGCIQSIVKQLFEQSVKTPDELKLLYSEYRHGTPSLDQMVQVLITILEDDKNFIVIDALDECREEEGEMEREALFQCLAEVTANLEGGFNIFIASRAEPDIKRELTQMSAFEVNMEQGVVDEDIRSALRGLLPKVAKFKTWPEAVKKEIEDTLATQANGMFRWAACQLDALKLCTKPANALRQLQHLPRTLEDTYARILQRVPPENEKEMRSILMLLAFSARPMTIQEVAEATAVDLEAQAFLLGERFGDAYDMLELCSSLVSLSEVSAGAVLKKEIQHRQLNKDVRIVAFAHFSVKEYIVSELARKSFPDTFSINESLSRRALTEMCLIYLLDFNDGKQALEVDHNEYPFIGYAALHWTTHLTLVPDDEREKVTDLLIRLFDPDHTESLMNYLNLYNPISSWNMWEQQPTTVRTLNFGTKYRNKRDFETPLYYACYYGINPVVDAILGRKGSHSRNPEELGSALEAAASRGNDEIIERLLKEGANPNAKHCPQYFRPLQAAARSGSPSTIKLLLSAGADVSEDSYGGELGTALHVAANQGSVECVQILIDAGHALDYVQVGTFHHGTALAAAAVKGHDKVIACLLRAGASPIAFSYWHNYPLNLACELCSLESVKLLLDAGASVQGEGGHTALHEAAVRGDISIMKLLLDCGADINAPGSTYGTPLKGAIQSRDAAVVQFMLDRGADINGCGSTTAHPVDQAIFGGNCRAADKLLEMGAKFSGTALAEALGHSSKEYLVPVLLRKGADPNTEHKRYGNVLQLAIENRCEEDTIKSLLAAGADINAVEGEYGTALQMAVVREREEIVRLLLVHGADPNMPACGKEGNPLQAAVIRKLEPVIQLLLDKGADINAVGGRYGNVLQAAAKTGNEDLVAMLLAKSVKVDTIGGEYGTALRAAVAMNHEGVVRLLLQAGANPNIRIEASHSTRANSFTSGSFHSAVEIAAESANITMFQLLLDYGMELSPDVLDNAFAKAVNTPRPDGNLKGMVEFMVSKGADIKRHGGLALFFASGWNRPVEVVQELISLGAPVNFAVTGDIGSALMHAIEEGNKEIIEALLDAGADINLGAGESGTALITATAKGRVQLAIQLLDQGADPNIQAGKWGTALTVAARNGDEEIFHELLKRGANFNIKYGFHGTALQAAISAGYYHLAQKLLDLGADPHTPGLYTSPLICVRGHEKPGQVELFERLIGLGVDLDVFDVERPEESGMLGNIIQHNALQNAIYYGNETTTKLLLDAGANINAVGGTHGTALIEAIKEGELSLMRLLLERGADVNLVGGKCGTALQAAALRGKAEIVELLLEKGADVNLEGGEDGTALQAASQKSGTKIMEVLLARGAEVNTNCGRYGNPLQAAAASGRLANIKTLLEHGADINHRGGHYGFALQAAACSNRCDPRDLELMKFLLDNGADVNAVGGEFGTALQAAAYHHKAFVEMLLEYGADPRIEGGKYGSAIGAAKEMGFNRVVKMLMDRIEDKR